ncbi:hypothetical protein PMAC_000817 [Pneumocystis sp. 'macacae']|nr:hypothetical protein PMAC_000817 [Pneumocystis sp. 'macacae']
MSFFTLPMIQKKCLDVNDQDMLSELVNRLIFSADDEGRPLVILNASNFPDPKDVDYDILLKRMLLIMDTYVDDNDYSVVLFAGGVRHRPSWNWFLHAYHSLGWKYRKYIKILYIVHSTWWVRVMLDCMHHLVSPKFARKIIYVSTLSELAKLVPFQQINVPADVYAHNLKYELNITLPGTMFFESKPQMFGLSLSQVMGTEGENGLPKVVKDICAYIRSEALTVKGLFRRSPSSVLLKQVREAYDRGNPVTLSEYGPHLAAVLLKLYLRSLPDPLFTHNLYPLLRKISDQSSANILFIRDVLLPKLSKPVVMLLSSICSLLHDVSLHSKDNLMHPRNLSICISPTLVRHPTDPLLDIQLCNLGGGLGMLMVIAIESTYDVFDFDYSLSSESSYCRMIQDTHESPTPSPPLDLISAPSSQVSLSPVSSCVSPSVSEQSKRPASVSELCTSNETVVSPKYGIINESISLLKSRPNRSPNLTVRRCNFSSLSSFSSVCRKSSASPVYETSNSKSVSRPEISASARYTIDEFRFLKSKTGYVEGLKKLYEKKFSTQGVSKQFNVSELHGKRVMI